MTAQLAPRVAEARAFLPAPVLPLAWFAGAHVALAIGLGVLAVAPGTAGAFHVHPQMLALVHLLTLGWISGSILGAFYIVAPLALGLPFPARRGDVVACVAFWVGTAGMVGGFWLGRFDLVGHASLLVLAPIAWIGGRAVWGLYSARVPGAVAVHVALAFINMTGAGLFGLLLAANRMHGWFDASPLALAAAHAHFAVLGWAAMMIIGVSYRLIPMFLPAAMPVGRSLIWSAVLLEVGALGMAWALATGGALWPWAACVAGAFAWFSAQIRGVLRHRRPRPAELQGRDWSTWQTHTALLYLVVAMGTGLWLTRGDAASGWTWVYGVTALLGFVAQMVVGIQGRLLPMHVWYAAMTRLGGVPPRSAHRLASPRLALAIYLLWLGGVPLLAAGLGLQWPAVVSAGASALCVALVLQLVHAVRMLVVVRQTG